MEYKIELSLVTADQTGEDEDMVRASIDTDGTKNNFYIGWGKNTMEALKNLDLDIEEHNRLFRRNRK